MSYFYDTFMGHRRDQWLRSIHAIEVQTGGSWHRGAINKKLVEGRHACDLRYLPDTGLRGLHDRRLAPD